MLQQDEWALIAKYNYLKEQEDKRNKHSKQRSQYKIVKNELDIQLEQKKMMSKEIEQNEDYLAYLRREFEKIKEK